MGSKSKLKYPFRRETEGDLTEKEEERKAGSIHLVRQGGGGGNKEGFPQDGGPGDTMVVIVKPGHRSSGHLPPGVFP